MGATGPKPYRPDDSTCHISRLTDSIILDMVTETNKQPAHWDRTRVVAWVLAISYMVGAPLAAFLEFNGQTMSERFGYPPGFIYATSFVQFICSIGLLLPRFASWAAILLTAIALGAVASHLRIGSPITSLPALAFAAAQIWFIRSISATAPETGNTS